MKSLSSNSRDFLNAIERAPKRETKIQLWKQNYTSLFGELFEIIESLEGDLQDTTMGRWSLNYEAEESFKIAFSFNLNRNKAIPNSQIIIRIAPFGDSFIEVIPCDSICKKDLSQQVGIINFFNSAAYKRYFASNDKNTKGIRAVIPGKQITSRHLGDYLSHLINVMKPYLAAISCKEEIAMKAA